MIYPTATTADTQGNTNHTDYSDESFNDFDKLIYGMQSVIDEYQQIYEIIKAIIISKSTKKWLESLLPRIDYRKCSSENIILFTNRYHRKMMHCDKLLYIKRRRNAA